jgi:CheY-like chemotaxis protein
VSKTVLCVDDDAAGLLVRTRILELSGYKVLAAASGRQALELFATQPVGAVLLDYCMPDMNGDAVAEEIRRLNPSVPLVLLSAYPSLPERVLQVVDKVIAKPQHPQVLLNLLASVFAETATCPPDQSAA